MTAAHDRPPAPPDDDGPAGRGPWLTVHPLGRRMPLPAGATLLEAARAGGLALRSSCRNGTCRACLARVESGRVRHRIPWPGLSPDERAEGWVLPCVAVADGDGDVVLHQPLVEAVVPSPSRPTSPGPGEALAGPDP